MRDVNCFGTYTCPHLIDAAWSAGVDEHAHRLTRHLQVQLERHFDKEVAAPRNSSIGAETWACVPLKRHAKGKDVLMKEGICDRILLS